MARVRTFRPGLWLALAVILASGVAFAQSKEGSPAKGGDSAEVVKFIDEQLAKSWEENKTTPSARCDDYEFIRRVSIDLIGRIATPKEIDEFLKDPKESRRAKLVDRLLKTEEYNIHWANMWTNWSLTRTGVFGRGQYHQQTQDWFKDQFAQNKAFNQIVTDLITASGKNTDNGAVNFILAHVGDATPAADAGKFGQFEMVPITSRISRLFLGIQTQCTQCHDHPFDAKLKQHHFWGINAFLRQVRREGTPPNDMRNNMTRVPLTLADSTTVNGDATVFFEKRNAVVLPARAQFLDGTKLLTEDKKGEKVPVQGIARRQELAQLIIKHPNFPKAIVNRYWGHFFGRGFTTPVDDFNDQNQPSHPELLEELGKRFRHYGFDQKMVFRWICNSQAYSLSCTANKTNEKPDNEQLFSRMLLKSLAPEVLFESLMIATQPQQKKEEQKELRTRWLDSLISNFGDDEGNEVSFNGTVVQALMMMNGNDLNGQIASNKQDGTVWVVGKKRGATPKSIITDLYMHTLNRPPTQKELDGIAKAMKMNVKDQDPIGPYQDLLWALINCNEFMLNH